MRAFAPLVALAVVSCTAAAPPSAVAAPETETPATTTPPPAPTKLATSALEALAAPDAQQLAHWRALAQHGGSTQLRELALEELAYRDDPFGLDLARDALGSEAPEARAHAARVLAYYATTRPIEAEEALLAALSQSTGVAATEIVWALVVSGGRRVAARAIELFREGVLQDALRLDGGPAFAPLTLGALLEPNAAELLRQRDDVTARTLASYALAARAEQRDVRGLLNLLRDPDLEVSRFAAVGLARIGGDGFAEKLGRVLATTDAAGHQAYLDALADHAGTPGLLLAGDAVPRDLDRGFVKTRAVFDRITGPRYSPELGLNDPRGGDALFSVIARAPHIHWQIRAAVALAQIGDLRALPTLARRLQLDTLHLYRGQSQWELELQRDDSERVVAARLLADLSDLHPDQQARIRQEAEDAVLYWLDSMPSPHANGMRAVAKMGSARALQKLHAWAQPAAPLPQPGQQPPMPEEWVIAQVGLRYLGATRDAESWPVLEQALLRRPSDIDVTMESLLQGGLAILGMTLRALGVGAAQGMSEWEDARAFSPLLRYVLSRKENEQSREAACVALAWVARPSDLHEITTAFAAATGSDRAEQFIRQCLLETLTVRATPAAAPMLARLLLSARSGRHSDELVAAARGLGRTGLPPPLERRLLTQLETSRPAETPEATALALILGGSRQAALRAALATRGLDPATRARLLTDYRRGFTYVTEEDLGGSALFRWVDNAVAISRFREQPQALREWPELLLSRALQDLQFDNGPHTLTRIVFRMRLLALARAGSSARRRQAIDTLRLAREQGALLALTEEHGETGALARRAYQELLRPRAPSGDYDFVDER